MKTLPTELYRAAQVRELDRTAIEDFRIPGYTLMQRAGQAAFDVLRARWPQAANLRVIAGPGNNGGDGYVVARLAHQAGLSVQVLQLGDAGRLRGDALRARQDYLAAGGGVEAYAGRALAGCHVIVDALLGTGLEREVTGDFLGAIEAVNAHPAPVLAVDIPSGLHADRGVPLGAAVRARCTVTFIGLKQGLFTGLAPDYCGEICFADLGVPQAVYARQEAAARRIALEQYSALLRPRERTVHKGHFGHVLVIGGEQGTSGAARMAAEAAARSGAGLVSVATRAAHAPVLNVGCPVLMVHGAEDAPDLEPLLARATVVAIGPGLGRGDWGRRMFTAALACGRPLVMDADALNLLTEAPVSRQDWILTPHPGEAGRLLGRDAGAIQIDRYGAAEALVQRLGGVVELKGAGTVVRGRERTAVCSAGNPGMATGGMGDVLTGIVSALLAQGLEPVAAAELGVCLHAAAGDAAARQGERGLLATDLLAPLRDLLNP
jgi:NAD(P)H-hydrate epimerase